MATIIAADTHISNAIYNEVFRHERGTQAMHRIGYLLKEGFQVMALGTQTVFEFANVVAREQFYQVSNYSLEGATSAHRRG